jgi:type II secretory pathway pseudopilin PulG
VELMVVMTIMLIGLSLGYPALRNLIHRERLLGFARGATAQLGAARQEAVKRGVPVVVELNLTHKNLRIFANRDEDPALAFAEGTDLLIGQVDLPTETELFFQGPPRDTDPLDGLTVRPVSAVPDPPEQPAFVFLPDGSVESVGGVRVSDKNGNYLELRASPQATGRIVLRKWDADEDEFLEQGHNPSTGESLWKWY